LSGEFVRERGKEVAVQDALQDPLLQELISREQVTQEQVLEAVELIDANLKAGQAALAGTRYVLDQNDYTFQAFAYPAGQEKYHLQLPKPQGAEKAIALADWQAAGSHLTLFNPETAKKAEDIAWQLSTQFELIQSKERFFWNGSFLQEHNLALSNSFFWNASPRQNVSARPLDLFVGYQGALAALADRGAGQVHLISLEEGTLLKTLTLRNPGSSKTLNLCLAEKRKQLYISDNSTSITVISLEDYSSRKISPGVGLLGNCVLSQDESLLFVLATKPNPGLKVIDLNSEQLSKDIAIKGDLFSTNSDSPVDLMALSPDGQQLLFMTYLNDPDPFTPIITVVDAVRQKTTQRFSIKDGTRPISLSFLGINPIAAKNQTVLEVLLGQGALSDENVRDARVAVRQKALEDSLRQQEEQKAAVPTLDLDQRAFEELQKEKDEEEVPEEGAEEGPPPFKPEKAAQMNISPVADELITKVCSNALYMQSKGEIDLLTDPDLTENLVRVQSAATRARNELEWYTGAVIKLKNVVGEHHLDLVILREQMEDLLHKHERDSLVTAGLKTVPSNCPNCSKPLFGSYICSYCGYEVERPEELLKRGIISIASIRPLDNLTQGHFLMIDMEGKRILEVDEEKSIFWTMGKDILMESSIELVFPRDAVRLATRNTLITDYSSNRIMEITPSGRLFWEFNQGKSSEHMLKNPVRATANGLNHVLIVDQGQHRVIEVDKDSDIRMQYGQTNQPGIAEGLLNTPSDIQRLANGNLLITDTGNHRILELEDMEVVWQYGNPENKESGGYGNEPGYLSYPQSALRQDNGHTLIVDAGNLRIMELDEEGTILWEHFTNTGPEEHHMDSPYRATYFWNGLVSILGESSMIEYDPKQKKIVWGCLMSDFERAKAVLQVEQSTKRFVKHGVRNPYMRVTEKNEESAETAKSEAMKALISKRMSTVHMASANKAHISLFGKPTLEPLSFYLVDRTKNRVISIDREGRLDWRYGENEGEKLLKPHACTRTADGHVLIADTDQHRIIEIDPQTSQIVWQFGETGKSHDKEAGLNRPRSAQRLANGHTLVVDQGNTRVFELNTEGQIVWSYEGVDRLTGPYQASKLESGNVLIADWGAHQVIEVNAGGEVVWQFGVRKASGDDHSHLSYPEFATRLKTGNTLIADTRNDRVIEVSPEGEVVWEFSGRKEIKYGSPVYVQRMANGNTLVSHSHNRQMIEVSSELKALWKLMMPFDRPAPKPTATETPSS
jgi:outer membrane protein assembly factor BamB